MTLDLHDPVLATYAIAAALLLLKASAMSWWTIIRMIGINGGFRSPEDLKKTPFNPAPDPKQLAPDDRVDRIRRIHLNDLENLPFFLIAGFLFLLTAPSLALAQWLLYGYVALRLLHTLAYATRQLHEVRATFWSAGSFILIYMIVRTLLAALGA